VAIYGKGKKKLADRGYLRRPIINQFQTHTAEGGIVGLPEALVGHLGKKVGNREKQLLLCGLGPAEAWSFSMEDCEKKRGTHSSMSLPVGRGLFGRRRLGRSLETGPRK